VKTVNNTTENAWSGDGLPPVGTRCIRLSCSDWRSNVITHNELCRIVAHVEIHGEMMAVCEIDFGGADVLPKERFAPSASVHLLMCDLSKYDVEDVGI